MLVIRAFQASKRYRLDSLFCVFWEYIGLCSKLVTLVAPWRQGGLQASKTGHLDSLLGVFLEYIGLCVCIVPQIALAKGFWRCW